MENRKPEAPVATARRKPLAWILASGCIILVAFLVVLQWPGRLSAPDAGAEFTEDGTLGQPLPATQAFDASAGAAQSQGAMIIDDPAAQETRNALESLPSFDGTTPASGTSAASTAKAPRRSARGSSRQRASRTASAKAPETDLLSTLMRIIQQDENAAAAQPASMDALIAKIEAEDSRNRHENQAALASLGGGNRQEASGPARSQDVQQQLRACPRANTVAGIECRRRICAPHAGKDAACPRQ